MRNFIFVAVLCLLAFLPSQAQEIKTQFDGWRGLTLDVSTVEDAVAKLGKPTKDEINKDVEIISRHGADWLNITKNQKIFRKLTFDKPEGFAKAKLYFKDNKLAIIELEAKYAFEEGWLDPDDLNEVVDADFKPFNAMFRDNKLPSPAEFAGFDDPTTKKEFRAYYEMIAVTEKSFVFAGVENREKFSVLGGNSVVNSKKKRDKGGSLPGNVRTLQIISRSLSKNS